MNDVVNLIRLKRDADSVGLSELEREARERFEKVETLRGSKWEDSSWFYRSRKNKILFEKLCGGELPEELQKLSKVFLVDILWRQRLRAEPYSSSYVTKLAVTFKIWGEMNVESLSQITQDLYDATIVYLRDKYAEPAPTGVLLNKTIIYLNEQHLLNANIDTKVISKALGNTDEYGIVLAKKEKMPLPELVKAIIHLKWAIDDKGDNTAKGVSDKLCILTQAFQFGLGLRIGEVLRLPQNPLVEMDGEVFCMVWTEKGSMPMARYVPTIWRQVLKDAVEEIQKITKPYRQAAVDIENEGVLGFLDNRVSELNQEKEKRFDKMVAKFDAVLEAQKKTATKFWKLKTTVVASEYYELKDLNSILPFASKANDAVSLLNFYRKADLDITSKLTGTRKHRHYVTGAAIIRMIDGLIEKSGSYICPNDLFPILNSKHLSSKRSKDDLINNSIEHFNGLLHRVTFYGEGEKSTNVAVISRDSAVSIIRTYVLGGDDTQRFIPLKELESLLPELFNQKSASRDYVKTFCGNKKRTFYTSGNGQRDFYKVVGYLADIGQMKNFFLAEYERMNLGIEKELIDAAISEYESEGVEISSKSFKIKQQPSEYLFIRAGMRGGEYFDYLPQIMGYHAVRYFFMGNDRQESAFSRYNLDIDNHITDSWQSHKGRHWQTTSLFRAGMAELVVNKWMGRTTGQGENYNHNSGRERAKAVGEAMLESTERFLGHVPNKVNEWKAQEITSSDLSQHLNDNLKSIQYSPLGYCTRDLYLKPCEFNLRCLVGNEGVGCKHYIYDLHDPSHKEKITAERDRSSLELSRLFEVYEKGVEAAKMHIEHHMCILRNTTSILENAEIILTEEQLENLQDYMPFKKDGSYPDDCPFQCGGDE